MMRQRIKDPNKSHLYPRWKKPDGPNEIARKRDGDKCVDCGLEQYAIVYNERTGRPHVNYNHGSHLHKLDPFQVEPIEGQCIRTRCPSCHYFYDEKWKAVEEEVNHQRVLHGIALDREHREGRFGYVYERFLRVL